MPCWCAIASILISPIYLAKFINGETLGMAAFLAAIIGGFNQVRGAILGGFILGVLDNLSAAYLSSKYRGAFPLLHPDRRHHVAPAGSARPRRGAHGMNRARRHRRRRRLRCSPSALPLFLKPYGIYLSSMWAVLTIAAMGLNLTLGYAGQVSLAQGAFVGIGAYTAALLMHAGVPYPLAFVAAGLLCFSIGWVLGYPALRVQHHYLAFVTLAFTTLVFLVLRNEEWLTGGIYGMSGIPRPVLFGWSTQRRVSFYYFCLGVLAVLAAGTWWMLRSPWGRAFVALRENPMRALSLGLDTRRYTLMAFAIGSSLGGLAGARLCAAGAISSSRLSFALGLSLNLLLMVIVGGSGYFFGPFVGALVAVLLPEWLRFIQSYYLMFYAVLVMVMMAFCPTGILGLLERIIKAMTLKRNPPQPALRPERTSQ